MLNSTKPRSQNQSIMDNSEISFSDLLKKFNFKPTLLLPINNEDWFVIQIYKNEEGQKVEVEYSYEDDYLSLELTHRTGKSVGGSFEACIDLKLWENLFNKNKVEQ